MQHPDDSWTVNFGEPYGSEWSTFNYCPEPCYDMSYEEGDPAGYNGGYYYEVEQGVDYDIGQNGGQYDTNIRMKLRFLSGRLAESD